MSNGQRNGATHRRIGRTGDGRRSVVGDGWRINGDCRSGSIDGTTIGSGACVASWVSDLGADGIWAFSQRLRQLDCVGAARQYRRAHGKGVGALSNRQRNGATHRRIGRTGDGRRGVIGDCWRVNGDDRRRGIDGVRAASRSGADIARCIRTADRCADAAETAEVSAAYRDAEAERSVSKRDNRAAIGTATQVQSDRVANFCFAAHCAGDGYRGRAELGAVENVVTGDRVYADGHNWRGGVRRRVRADTRCVRR